MKSLKIIFLSLFISLILITQNALASGAATVADKTIHYTAQATYYITKYTLKASWFLIKKTSKGVYVVSKSIYKGVRDSASTSEEKADQKITKQDSLYYELPPPPVIPE